MISRWQPGGRGVVRRLRPPRWSVLMRPADRGLVEARWEDTQPEGRPRRHLYRLTAAGGRERRG